VVIDNIKMQGRTVKMVVTCSKILSYQLTVRAVKSHEIHVTVDCFQKYFVA